MFSPMIFPPPLATGARHFGGSAIGVRPMFSSGYSMLCRKALTDMRKRFRASADVFWRQGFPELGDENAVTKGDKID
ncbi:MAG: hypothetical protein KIS86_05285 [Devosia sp.]|nr:hypothetical protein [Devosia sp.]